MSTPLEQALRRLVADGTLTDDQARGGARSRREAAGGQAHRATDPVRRTAPPGRRSSPRSAATSAGPSCSPPRSSSPAPAGAGFGQSEKIAVLGVPALLLLAAAVAVLALTPGGWPVRHRRGTGPRRRLAAALVVVGGALLAGSGRRHGPRNGRLAGRLVLRCRHGGRRGRLRRAANPAAPRRDRRWPGRAAPAASAATNARWQRGRCGRASRSSRSPRSGSPWPAPESSRRRRLGLTVGGALAFVGAEIVDGRRWAGRWVGYLVLAAVAGARPGRLRADPARRSPRRRGRRARDGRPAGRHRLHGRRARRRGCAARHRAVDPRRERARPAAAQLVRGRHGDGRAPGTPWPPGREAPRGVEGPSPPHPGRRGGTVPSWKQTTRGAQTPSTGGVDEVARETGAIEVLSPEQCWQLLASAEVGRLAVAVAGDVDIFPLNFAVDDGAILFRTAEGTKLVEIVMAGRVAFEVDGYEPEHGRAWSVVVKGHAAEPREVRRPLPRAGAPALPVERLAEGAIRPVDAGPDHGPPVHGAAYPCGGRAAPVGRRRTR